MTIRSLAIGPGLGELSGVRAFVREAARDAGASQHATEDLVQAADEAACNVARHGYRGHDGEIRVEAERRGESLVVRILDRAPLFDPTTAPKPDVGVPALARRPGGMGIHLLTTMVDEVHHRPRPGGGNELELVRRLDDPATTAHGRPAS